MTSLFNIFILILPFVSAVILYFFRFETDIQKTLELFLPFIWGLMVALGGGVIFLKRYPYENQGLRKNSLKVTSEYIEALSLILIFQTLIFLSLGILFPARLTIKTYLLKVITVGAYDVLRASYASGLYAFIFLPAIGATVVGAWCLILALNEKGA